MPVLEMFVSLQKASIDMLDFSLETTSAARDAIQDFTNSRIPQFIAGPL